MPKAIRVTLANYSDIKDSVRCPLCHNDSIRWHDLTGIALCNNCNALSPFDNEGKEKPVFTWWKFLASGGSTPRKK